jgi:hypothetical protein
VEVKLLEIGFFFVGRPIWPQMVTGSAKSQKAALQMQLGICITCNYPWAHPEGEKKKICCQIPVRQFSILLIP